MTLCSKCGTRAARAEGQRYCDACHAASQKDYRKLAAHKRERAAYYRGFEECRAKAVSYFEAGGLWRDYTGYQAAQAVRDVRST